MVGLSVNAGACEGQTCMPSPYAGIEPADSNYADSDYSEPVYPEYNAAGTYREEGCQDGSRYSRRAQYRAQRTNAPQVRSQGAGQQQGKDDLKQTSTKSNGFLFNLFTLSL